MRDRSLEKDDAEPTEARERIRLSAFRLFSRNGYARTSIQDISDAAGVKKPLLYYYFGSKEALYRDLLQQSSAHLRSAMDELAASGVGGCEERLGQLGETMLQLARENQDPVRFFFAHFFAADDDRPTCDTQAFEQAPPMQIQAIVADGLRRGEITGDPMDLLRLYLGAIQFSVIHHLRHPEEEPLDPGLGRRIASSVMRGFLPRTGQPNQ